MRKSDLAKEGDKIKFQSHVEIKEGYNYQKGKIYDGYVVSHRVNQATEVSFIGDDGSMVNSSIYYDNFCNGMESFEILISDEELEHRVSEWLTKSIEIEKKTFEDRVNALKKIKFV